MNGNRDSGVAVITGGANGIGEGIAEALAARRFALALIDIQEDQLARTVDRLQGEGATVIGLRADVRDPASLGAAAAEIRAALGPVTVLCANAGSGGRERPAWEIPLDEWRWVYDLNVFGVIATVQAFLPAMIDADAGHVVITASMQGITTGRLGPYASSKHAAASIAEILGADLARQGSAVRVSCLCPSFTQNSMLTNPDQGWLYRDEPLTEAEREARLDVVRKLAEFGKPAREVGELVADSLDADRFWLIPEPAAVERVWQRAERVSADAGLPPRVANV